MTPFTDYSRCDCFYEDGCNGSCRRFLTTKQVAGLIAAAVALAVLLIGVGFCMGKALTAASGVGG